MGIGFAIADSGSIIARLHAKGAGTTSATRAMLLENSNGDNLLEVNDAGEILLGATNCKVLAGTGSPEGVVTASVGSIYLRNDGGAGTSFYVKESGFGTNTGWVGK